MGSSKTGIFGRRIRQGSEKKKNDAINSGKSETVINAYDQVVANTKAELDAAENNVITTQNNLKAAQENENNVIDSSGLSASEIAFEEVPIVILTVSGEMDPEALKREALLVVSEIEKLDGLDEIRVPANIAGSAIDPSEGGRPEEEGEE